jgi:hypothetical protein
MTPIAQSQLVSAAQSQEVEAIFDRWKRQLAGRSFSPTAELIREDRNR